jgi:isopenicillin N synthase-like dioxygenase
MIEVPVVSLHQPRAAQRIDAACREVGFFAVSDHGVPDSLRRRVIDLAAQFFALPTTEKAHVSMAHGGPAWRGWFPLGGELTSGIADLKEGFYFGRELPADPRPMHGPNLWPRQPAALRGAITEWMAAMERVGQHVLALMAEGLGLQSSFFTDGLTADPTPLFRVFRYPPHPSGDDTHWGVGEHTDYGLITLLAHDGTPGLEVRASDNWVAAPHDPELLICNLGDMLDRLTGGRYRSTPHRVRNHASHDRYSLPFFLDPGWEATIDPIDIGDGWVAPADTPKRWDHADLGAIGGTYGQWLTAKVSRVFPDLAGQLDGG